MNYEKENVAWTCAGPKRMLSLAVQNASASFVVRFGFHDLNHDTVHWGAKGVMHRSGDLLHQLFFLLRGTAFYGINDYFGHGMLLDGG